MSHAYWERMQGVRTTLPDFPVSFWFDDENDMYANEHPNTSSPCSVAVSLLFYLSHRTSRLHMYAVVKTLSNFIALPIDSCMRSMCRKQKLPHPPNVFAFLPTLLP